ncbi:PIN domain-containing protein [Sphaerimonospora cavernae]|uniref:PIN domain-containing protein n=1 Tax=Sphaerimonospora cavernae TaxID=1740611 RepID=A0ABV6U1Y6_9ACTN
MIRSPRYVFDTGALIQLERGDRRLREILKRVTKAEAEAIIPQTVIAEVWRGGPRQARVAALLKLADDASAEAVSIDELTPERSRQIGKKIGESGHDDIVDVNVALSARDVRSGQLRATVLTADRNDLLKVDGALAIIDV